LLKFRKVGVLTQASGVRLRLQENPFQAGELLGIVLSNILFIEEIP
jgi:hypothetical protein